MNKVRKPSNIVLDWKILISAFVYFLTAIANVSFPEGELGEVFSIFPNFPDLARLKPFINLYSRIHVYRLCYARYKNLFYW